MGAGASTNVSPASVGASKSLSSTRQAQGDIGVGGTTTHLDVVEGGVSWLAAVIEAEKREKDWLASKYDEKCTEVKSLQQEVARLQGELERRPPALQTSSSSASPSCSAPEKEPCTIASPTNSTGLMGRRGLNLSGISMPQRSRMQTGSAVEVVSPVKEASPMIEAAAEKDFDELPPEPMSALLRRRSGSDDWLIEGGPVTKKTTSVAGEQGDIRNLRVGTQKVFSMVGDAEDCPASPKRVLGRSISSRERPGLSVRKVMSDMTAGSGGTA